MIVLVTGGSGSGKSAYAEKLCMELTDKNKYYIATMQPYGEEGRKRIERHHRLRAGKGFRTLECYTGLEELELDECGCVLLECISNLVANEMFAPEGRRDQLEIRIREGILHIAQYSDHLVIVTNQVFSDGICYSEETQSYQQMLGKINQLLAADADIVAEVVCGIPLKLKG